MPVGGPHREDWPALPLSRTVYTVLVFATRGTSGSAMGCGNQRRGRPRQYEKSGLAAGLGRQRLEPEHGALSRTRRSKLSSCVNEPESILRLSDQVPVK